MLPCYFNFHTTLRMGTQHKINEAANILRNMHAPQIKHKQQTKALKRSYWHKICRYLKACLTFSAVNCKAMIS